MKKNTFGLVLCSLVLGLLPAFSFAQTPAPCGVKVAFDVVDAKGGSTKSIANKDSDVLLTARLIEEEKGKCDGLNFKLGFFSIYKGGFTDIGEPRRVVFYDESTMLDQDGKRYAEKEITWQAAGLKDAKTGELVKNNGVLSFQAYASYNDSYYIKSSVIDVSVKNESTAPNNSGGGGEAPAPKTPVSANGLFIDNPLEDQGDLLQFFFYLLKRALAFVGILATVMIIFGGYKMVVSNGNPSNRKKGQDTIVWAVIGLAITLLSFSIVAIVQNILRVK